MRKYIVSINGKTVGTFRARSQNMAALKAAWLHQATTDDAVIARRAA
jgi:hypothetical protein